jgi:hypothetical protein
MHFELNMTTVGDEIEETAGGAVIMADSSEPTREEKIADALRAAPAYIADSATVVDWDMTTVLREGSPDWICVPTPPGKPEPAPMCGDPAMIQWFREIAQGKAPTIDRIGISYMLMGEVGADFDHPEATQPPAGKDWYHAGPHVMFVFPQGTGRILQDLGHDFRTAVCQAGSWGRAAARRSDCLAGRKSLRMPGDCSCGCNG